jgi:hypothetical protein
MRICTEIYKNYANIIVTYKEKRERTCGDEDAEGDAAEEEDSQNLLG